MSNNRSSNRRRGRGNNRSQGGNQLNRIDSRARGNAPQLLEKYRKLAQDSALNGDRVQAEYYLQFADHYFRVLADSRSPKDDTRVKRDAERGPQDDEDEESENEGDRGSHHDRGARRDNRDRGDAQEGERGSEDGDSDDDESSGNPFTREDRGSSGRTRKDAGSGRKDTGNGRDDDDNDRAGLDPSILPPAIGKGDDEQAERPPRKPRRAKPRGSDDESLETVS